MISIKDFIKSVYFNFKYLPPPVACKLPVILHNVYLDDMRGQIKIESASIHRGMIRIGDWGVKVFPKEQSVWQNHGGTVTFRGACRIGAGSALSVNSKANLIFGDDFRNTYGLKIIASRTIEFGKTVRLGWNVFVMDTNMHPLKDSISGRKGSGGKSIRIGDCNWFSTNCIILPGVETPERVICALGTTATRGVEWESYCMYGGSPIRKLRSNVYRDFDDDKDSEVFG